MHLADFRKAEGRGRLGLHCDTQCDAAVGIQAGRDVDGEDRHAAGVEQVQDVGVESLDSGVEAGAEDRVDDERRGPHRFGQPSDGGRGRHFGQRHACRLHGAQCAGGVPAHVGHCTEQGDLCPHALAAQQAGDDKPVAAVVALAGHDEHPGAPDMRELFEQHRRGTAPGALHQHVAGRAAPLDRPLIEPPHLRCADEHHRQVSSWPDARCRCNGAVARLTSYVIRRRLRAPPAYGPGCAARPPRDRRTTHPRRWRDRC